MPKKKKQCPLCSPEYVIRSGQLDDVRSLAVNAAECMARDMREKAKRHDEYVARATRLATTWQRMGALFGEAEDPGVLDALLDDLDEKLRKQEDIFLRQDTEQEQHGDRGGKEDGKAACPPE
jgi:hypothetical protein